MNIGRPNLSALVLGAHQTARAMRQNQLPDPQVRGFLEELLYKPQAQGGKDFWGCFAADLITSRELRNAVLAHLATWISSMNRVREPSSETWCTPEIERVFDDALFVATDAATRAASVAEFIAAAGAAAARGSTGAILLLEADRQSVELLRDRGESDASLDEMFLRASQVVEVTLPKTIASARTSWRGQMFAVPGSRETIIDAAKALLLRLLAHPRCGQVGWRLVLTRIFPGDPRRTQFADPSYDLATAPKSFVAWVEPYAADDWLESQRYPTTAIVFEPK